MLIYIIFTIQINSIFLQKVLLISRTERIWKRKTHPERLHFYYEGIKTYASDKSKIWCVNKIWRIRNRWWKTLRHRNKVLDRDIGFKCHSKEHIDIDYLDEYFNTRYRLADYTEYFD